MKIPLCDERKAMLFDLDGTLINSIDSVMDTMKLALQDYGYDAPSRDTLASLFGRSEIDVLRRVGVSDAKITDIIARWDYYSRKYASRITFFEGIKELLIDLRSQDCSLGVVTGTSREKTRFVPATIELYGLVDVIVTADDTHKGKPDPEPIQLALERMNLHINQAVFVGDSAFDLLAARAAGCPSIFVKWGGIKDENKLPVKPDLIVSTVNDLRKVLLRE